MHSTHEEIAIWTRSVELPPLPPEQENTESFYEDDSVTEITQEQEPQGYQNGRKVNYSYPSPPATPPPVALLAQLIVGHSNLLPAGTTAKAQPWASAFLAGAQAGNIGKISGKSLDKAQLVRLMLKGKKPHRSELPEPPTCKDRLETHLLCHL